MKVNKETTTKILVTRAHQFDDGAIMFNMIINGVTIYGCRLVYGKNGTFVSFPSRKGNDGNYYSNVFVRLSEDDVASIVAQIEEM